MLIPLDQVTEMKRDSSSTYHSFRTVSGFDQIITNYIWYGQSKFGAVRGVSFKKDEPPEQWKLNGGENV